MDLRQLCYLVGVTPRTVHYYIQLGLLPPSGARGRGAKYDRQHLGRLRLIKQLRTEHLPLAAIRERLRGLSDVQVGRALAATAEGPAPRPATEGPAPDTHMNRSHWERIVLAPEIELHVRRPLSGTRGRQVERLLGAARRILKPPA